MLESRIATSNKATGVALKSSERPFACGGSCRFFQDGLCHKSVSEGPIAKFARKKTIYSEGDRAGHSYKVLEGAVRLVKILSDGHRQVLDILLPGDTFGLEFSQAYSATAEAIGDTLVLRCSRTCIDERAADGHRHDMVQRCAGTCCATGPSGGTATGCVLHHDAGSKGGSHG